MMSVAMKFGWRLVNTRAGLAVIAVGFVVALYVGFSIWHESAKAAAIADARDGYVSQVELAEAQAELAELRRRAAVGDDANRVLQEKVRASEGQALRFAAELEAFEHETEINPDGVVDADLLRRLRSN